METAMPNPHPNQVPILKELRLTFHEDGQVIIGGSLEDKPICFYMMEIAKDTIKAFDPNNSHSITTPPSGSN